VTATDVEDIDEAIFKDPSDGVVIRQIMMLPKVSVFIEVYRCVVGGEDMQVDGFTVVLSGG
jgi:hypothetical protein